MSEQEMFFRKAAKESFKNAERFVKDAEILLKKKSYAHAFALAILAEEEMAKAAMYGNAADGIVGVEGKWREDLSKHHKVKQIIAFGIASRYEWLLIAEEAADFARKKARGNVQKSREIYEKKLRELRDKELKMFAEKRGDLYEHTEVYEELQRKREKAMYVDADLKKGEISSPLDFKKSTAKRYISHVEERLEVVRDAASRKTTDSQRKMLISIRNAFVNKLEGAQRRKILDWYGISEKELTV